MKEFGQYPVDKYLQKIGDSLLDRSSCLIKAEPGAGKTTRVPLHLLSTVQGGILVLEPRRLAARLSAERCAWFLDESCGKQVGYIISQSKKISAFTRLTFITEGIFLRLLRSNVTLEGIGAIVLDEFHERNIHTDIALSLVRNLQKSKRPDLKLAVMSATLDTGLLEKYLEDAVVFDISGRTFPVAAEYLVEKWADKGMEDSVHDAVLRMLEDSRCPGSILVFLTGLGDIMAIRSRLENDPACKDADILPLAAGLTHAEQLKVFENREKGETGDGLNIRKIVLSTNVAETSLTIPGVTGVIDTGLAKILAHAPWSGMPTLETRRISRASAVQRGGRAGRTQPGVVYRLYSQPDFVSREEFTAPDIKRIDLSHVLLEIMNLGYNPETMNWLETPDPKNKESAMQLLAYLGAVNAKGDITDFGRRLSVLPLHPRLAALTLQGKDMGISEDALLAACVISEKFVLKYDITDSSKDDHREPCDIAMQMDLLKASVHQKGTLSRFAMRVLDPGRRTRILELYGILARKLKLNPVPLPTKTDTSALSQCLLRGYPDRVAQRRNLTGKKGPALYHFCLGRGGMIGKGSIVHSLQPDFLVAIDAVENLKQDAAKGITIRICSALAPEILETDPGGLLRKEKREEFDTKQGTLTIVEDRYYGKLKLAAKKLGKLEENGGLARALEANWPYPFANDDEMKIYHKRVTLLNRFGINHNCPVFEGEMLTLFFQCICESISSLKELLKHSLDYYIEKQLSNNDRAVLDAYTPLELKMKNGKHLKINYPSDKDPYAEISFQNCFGQKNNPAIMQGALPLTLHLLAPNRRAAQITSDLHGFWKGVYKEVQKELSRRYPKHYWPDNPSNAEPVMLKRHAIKSSG